MTASGILFTNRNLVLLGRKGYGKLRNKWSGFGGSIKPYERLRDGAVREVLEEIYGIKASHDLVRKLADQIRMDVMYSTPVYTLFVTTFDSLMEISKVLNTHCFTSPFFAGKVPEQLSQLIRDFVPTKRAEIVELKLYSLAEVKGPNFDPFVVYDCAKLIRTY